MAKEEKVQTQTEFQKKIFNLLIEKGLQKQPFNIFSANNLSRYSTQAVWPCPRL